jgi:trimethylamine---corrinoid protein Co-methyltransferase
MLTESDLGSIDKAARDLLEDPGIRLEDEQAVELALAAGARPGASTGVVRMPARMIDEALALAPRSVRFASRDGVAVVDSSSPSRFWTGAGMFCLDDEGHRPMRARDLAAFARVIDTLPNVDAVVGTSIDDAPPPCRDFTGLRVMAGATRKHLRALCFTARGGEAMVEMGRVLAGSRDVKEHPVFSIGFTAHGPLRWTSLALGVFRATAGHGIPCTVNGEPMAGASAPVTLAGTAAVGTAEILAGIVVNQIFEPGRPCLFNLGFSHAFDMRHGFAVTGGPENVILAVAGAELARFYGLPSVSWMCTDSLAVDGQNCAEKMLAALAHAQAGVSTIWGVGQVESEKTLSPIQAVMDDEAIGMVRRVLRGVEVTEETLAVWETRRAGICGSHLDSDHTLRHFRDELYETGLLARAQRGTPGAARGFAERAAERVRDVLAHPAEPVLEEAEARELERIERQASRAILGG